MSKFNNAERSSPILTLADFIASEHSGDDLISFPSGTTDAVTRSRTSRSRYPAAQVAQLVEAIDGHAYEFCTSVDHDALLILCSIFTYAEPCQAANRGFCLIAQSLHPMLDDDPALADLRVTNKFELRVTLPFLLKGFSQLRENEQTRRWMGVLALELLEGCPENVEVLRSDEDQEWQGISQVMKHGNGEVLRLLAGSIVKGMISHGIPPEALWMPQDIPIWFNEFPLAARRDTQWIDDYEHYLQDMDTVFTQKRSNIFFALTATIGDQRYGIQNKSAIFITVSGSLLQVYIKPSRGEHATYVDIPLVSIANNGLKMSDLVQTDGSITLLIELESSIGATCFVDADVRNDTTMEFTLMSMRAASQLMHLLGAKNTVDLDASIAHQSEPIEQVSSEVENDRNEQVADLNTRHAPQGTDYSDPETMTVEAISSIPEEQRPGSSSAGLTKPQLVLQYGQLVLQRWRRPGLTKLRNDGADELPGRVDSIDVSALRHIEAFDTRNHKTSLLPPQRESNSVEEIERGLAAVSKATNYIPGEPLRSIAERKSAMYIPVHAREMEGPKLPKPSRLPQDDSRKRRLNSGLDGRENRQSLPANAASRKPIPTKPRDRLKPSMTLSKKNTTYIERQANGQTHPTHKSGERNDLYDIPKSSPVLAESGSSPERAFKTASWVSFNTRKAGKAAQKFRAQVKPSKEKDSTAEASMELMQTKPRRAAALNANRKIQGFGTSDAGGDPGKQQTLNGKWIRPMAIDKTKVRTIYAQDEHLATEIESDDEAKAAAKEPTHDTIEKTAETITSDTRRDRTRAGVLIPTGTTPAAEKGAKVNKATQEHDNGKTVTTAAWNATHTVKHNRAQSGILHKEVFLQDGAGSIGMPESSEELSTTHVPKTINVTTVDKKEFGEDGQLRLQDVSRSQPTQHIHSSKALTGNFKVQSISKAPNTADKAKPVILEANRQGSQHRSSGSRDPFASKLNAVVAIRRGAKVNHDLNMVTSAARKEARNKPTKDHSSALSGQANQRTVKRRISTPVLQNITEIGIEPPKRSKRKAHVEAKSISKKARVVSQGRSASDAPKEKTPPPAFRKTAIISFGTSGPRNQGTPATNQVKKPALPTSVAISAMQSARADVPICVANETEALSTQADRSRLQQQPRKQGSEAELTYYTVAEPQPLPTVDEERLIEPQGTRATISSALERIASKQSSQTIRVTHNGSPMPFRHPTNAIASVKMRALPLKDSERVDEGEQYGDDGREPCLSDDEDKQILQPTLPSKIAILQPSVPQTGAFNQVNASTNKKQTPSSPNAPSGASALAVHHEYRTGEIVNPRTEERIVPADPQDPFIGQVSEYSTFTRLLHNASMTGTKRPARNALDAQAKKARVSDENSLLEDPDKTLTEPTRKPQKTKLNVVERNSSSESSDMSSDEDESPTLIEKETEDTPSRWRKALQPHQRNMLDVLTQISHRLLAHMVKSEYAFLDMINDFKRSGDLLIDHLENEHQAKLDANAKHNAALAQNLMRLYQETRANLETEATRVTGQTKRLEAEWESNRRSSSVLANAALAACAV